MYRKIRIILAVIFFVGITLLLAGGGAWIGGYLDFMPKMQFLPAVLALNFGVIFLLLAITFVFGRIYCSVICPLGVFQDVFSWLGKNLRWRRKKRKLKYTPEKKWIRYSIWALFVVSLLLGFQVFVLLVAPYSIYGRFVHALFHGYAWEITAISIGTVILVAVLAFLWGRTWCNTICPVGTTLSFISRFSLFRPIIDADKCKSCKKCERNCKAQCIDIKHHKIDYSRCVTCFDCLDNCHFDALHYRLAYGVDGPVAVKHSIEKPVAPQKTTHKVDVSRRTFLISSTLVGLTALEASAEDKTKLLKRKKAVEAYKEYKSRPKVEPERLHPITPPGSLGGKHFYDHCTACHLCVASCPQRIIHPSLAFDHFMQPELTYAEKACDPECNRCAQVCPAGAILPYLLEDKKNQPAGMAVVDLKTCLFCGKCSKVCPYGAIVMEPLDPLKPRRRKPVVQMDCCVGCGACELACPVRPVSAIHVEGRE